MDIQDLINRLKQATVANQEAAVVAIIKKHEAGVVDLNIAQMMAGQNNDGSMIEPAYTERTVAIKKGKGQPSDRVTLRDEGLFQGKMYLEGDKFPLEVNSKDVKTGLLDEKYNADKFFGFQDSSKQAISQGIIKDDIMAYYRGIIGL